MLCSYSRLTRGAFKSHIPPRPTSEDCNFPLAFDTWPRYWQALGQEWRTEPEVSTDRQNFLTQLRETESNEEERSSPFQGIELSRGDIEWLLIKRKEATRPTINEITKPIISSTFSVDADDPFIPLFDDLDDLGSESTSFQDFGDNKTDTDEGKSVEPEYEYIRLNLQGAILRHINLRGLPLEKAVLSEAHLEESDFHDAVLRGADLRGAHLEGAIFCLEDCEAQLWDGTSTNLEGADLRGAHLEGADLRGVNLEGADLRGAHLEGADLSDANLKR